MVKYGVVVICYKVQKYWFTEVFAYKFDGIQHSFLFCYCVVNMDLPIWFTMEFNTKNIHAVFY